MKYINNKLTIKINPINQIDIIVKIPEHESIIEKIIHNKVTTPIFVRKAPNRNLL